MSFWTIGLLLANLFLVVVVIALPLGLRTTRRTIRIKASPARVWQTLYPLGDDAGFDDEIVAAREIEPGKAWLSYAWRGRDDRPIERLAAFEDVVAEARYTMRVIDDTSLDPTFWRHFSERVTLTPVDAGQGTEVALAQTDRYRGAAFYIFRHFALRRRMQRLKDWLETGKVVRSRLTFEHPLSQVGFATISALLLWPLFGLTQGGLMAAALLTAVIALHELGHVAAFRIAGHRSARMIFIPLLGGIAIGGRPYDKKFEVAFVALMGPGFSAFLVFACMLLAQNLGRGWGLLAITAGGLIALFNLANLLPLWRFDGAQVLRQVTGHWQSRVLAEVLLLTPVAGMALWLGSPPQVVAAFMAAAIGVAVLTRNAVFKPRKPLLAMSRNEAMAICLGLAAVVSVHTAGVLWAARGLSWLQV